MNAALFCFSENGCTLAEKLASLLDIPKDSIHTTEKFKDREFTCHKKISYDMSGIFSSHSALIFVGAAGIAVRYIAPFLKDKTKDPAVICIDDKGNFVIPILSGHIGGANKLAKDIADMLGAVPVITTATDINSRFSCDEWAARHDLFIASMSTAKEFSAEILKRDLPISSEYELPQKLPNGLFHSDNGDIGIYIGIKKVSPYSETLRLIPRALTLGIGCRRGTPYEKIDAAVKAVLAENNIDTHSICRICSIDVKKDEEGLIEYARKNSIPIEFFSADELDSVKGDFNESEFVRRTVGVGNVCERAALIYGGELIIKKTANDGVTVAASKAEYKIEF